MKRKDIELLRVTYLRGPNVWTYRPVIEAWVDIGDLEDFPSNTIPGFPERLAAWLPSLATHRCSVGEPGGFLLRLQEGTWPAHIMEHVAIELQSLAGMQVGFGRARQTSQRSIYKVAVRALNERVGRAVITAARDLVMSAIEDRPYDLDSALAVLRDIVDHHHLGPSTAAIVDAATEHRIPWLQLNEGDLVQLGYGARQRRIWTAETDKTSAIAEGIASDKVLTKTLLAACGVPVPEGRIVDSPEDAWEAAEDIGVPVVVKPSDADHSRGVFLDLIHREDIEAAFLLADAEGSDVSVERFILGAEYRLLVVGGRLVAATRGEDMWIEGDGLSTLRQLIDTQLNSDARRGHAEEFPLETIALERDGVVSLTSARQFKDGDSVPGAGQCLLIQRSGDMYIDVTDEVHPDVAATVGLAARVVGLNIAGIDMVAQDISRPLQEQGGAIVGVNAGPSLLMHLKPAIGTPRPVGRAIAEHLFPPESSADAGRIPVVGVTGSRGTTATARLVAWLLHSAGKHVGLACADGLYLCGRRVENSNCARWEAGRRLLINRSVDAAVLENGAEMILREGLSYDRCQVGVVTDVDGADTLGEFYIDEADQVYNVLRTQVDVVLPEGVAVLNAADSRVMPMAELCDGEVMLYAVDPIPEALVAHLANGGRAVFVRDGQLIIASARHEQVLARLEAFPCLTHAIGALSLEALLAGVGAALALGLASDLIVAGVVTFSLEDAAPALPPEPPIARGPKTKAGQADERLTPDAMGCPAPRSPT